MTSLRPSINFFRLWNPTIHPHFRNYKCFVRWRCFYLPREADVGKSLPLLFFSNLMLSGNFKLTPLSLNPYQFAKENSGDTNTSTAESRTEQQMKGGKNSSQWKAVFLLFLRENSTKERDEAQERTNEWDGKVLFERKRAFKVRRDVHRKKLFSTCYFSVARWDGNLIMFHQRTRNVRSCQTINDTLITWNYYTQTNDSSYF